MLPSGFRHRLALISATLRRGVLLHAAGEATLDASRAIERAWALCARHRLGQRSTPEVLAFGAAVKLWRWITTPGVADDADFATRVRSHLDHGSWADLAINNVDTGVDDPDLSATLHAVFDAAMARRNRQGQLGFAQRLATVTAVDSQGLGNERSVGSRAVLESRIASHVPGDPDGGADAVLFVVMDGMSAAAANEIVGHLTGELGWFEVGALPRVPRDEPLVLR